MQKSMLKFFSLEATSGLVLFVVLIAAILIANSGFANIYEAVLDVPIQIRVGELNVEKSLLLWINEGLMAVFFLILALEMKREIVEGELSKPAQLILPVAGAIGGIILPALVYWYFNRDSPETLRGWPIPTTTDIAFALGVIALLGKRVPLSLRIFLVALSIVDDILAVTIIAIVYTNDLSHLSLMLAALGIIALLVLNICNVRRIAAYILVAIFLWVCVLKSGVHATLAGAVVGAFVPLGKKGGDDSPLKSLEHALHPWVAFMVLPLFVFANGGVIFTDFSWGQLLTSVPLGIGLGLFVGKGIGVFLCCALLIVCRVCPMPTGANWRQLFGIACVTGIGFTMSLFIGALAFHGTPYEDITRQGVLFGSLLSGCVAVGAFLLGSPNTEK